MNKSEIVIKAPRFRTITLKIVGAAPFMQAAFSYKTRQKMRENMEAGSASKSKKVRDARDFENDFLEAQHISTDGWNGIPAASFRNASIDVCRMVGFKMTHAKLSVFVEADGFDKADGTPLVKIIGPPPEMNISPVRNATGVVDLRARPMWREWSAYLRMRYDEDQFSAEDVVNLVSRAGLQCGIGEGRPNSKSSYGLGFGLFNVESVSE